MSLIDAVHWDGDLPTINVVGQNFPRDIAGCFVPASRVIQLNSNTISSVTFRGDYPACNELTVLHEVAHAFDYFVLGGGQGFATDRSVRRDLEPGRKPFPDANWPLHLWWEAVQDSPSYELALTQAEALIRRIQQSWVTLPSIKDRKIGDIKYFVSPREVFARSYVQFVVRRSGHEKIGLKLDHDSESRPELVSYWLAGDFAPIESALESLLSQQNWLGGHT